MKTIYSLSRILLAITLLLLTTSAIYAEQPLKVAFGNALPPWVIPETDSGILIDILKATLEPEGFTIEPVYYPYARRLEAYKDGLVDVVCDINQPIMQAEQLTGYLSVIAYAYENIGVSLQKNHYNFSSIRDLAEYSVVAWQGAKTMLGGEYAEMAEHNARYKELPNQKIQVRLLYAGRYDVVQLDRQIFGYYRRIVSEEEGLDTEQPIDIFPLFGKNECSFLFKHKEVQTRFDKNFAALKQDGAYEAIYQKYVQ